MRKNSGLTAVLTSLWLLGALTIAGAAEQQSFWKDAETLCPGVQFKRIEMAVPRLQKWTVVRVDMGTGAFGMQATEGSPDLGKPMPDYPKVNQTTVRQRTADFFAECRRPVKEGGKGLDMVLAVNSAPWTPWCPPWNHRFGGLTGRLITQGKVLDAGGYGGPSFVMYTNGRMDIVAAKTKLDASKVWLAVSGFSVVLDKGMVTSWAQNDRALAPRTGFGISADGHVFYIVVVDGRQPDYSMGSTTGEVGEMLRQAGATQGMNMDGGGSTTLVVLKDGKGKVLTHQKGGWTRNVAVNVGIYRKASSAK